MPSNGWIPWNLALCKVTGIVINLPTDEDFQKFSKTALVGRILIIDVLSKTTIETRFFVVCIYIIGTWPG